MRPILLALAALLVALPAAAQTRSIRVCVVQSGRLTEVSAGYDTATGDTTVAGRTFASAYPTGPEYATGALWYVRNETITVGGRRYVKYGLPRVLGVSEVARAGEYQGVAVFAESGGAAPAEVVYLPVRPGCEFQPYQRELEQASTRGAGRSPAAAELRAGQTVRGTLSASDPTLDDESHYDLYRYVARARERVVIDLSSDDFDAFLAVGEMDGDELDEIDSNDDGPDVGTDSRIEITFPGAGTYFIRANSYGGGETGSYTLRLTSAGTVAASSISAPAIRAGEHVRGALSSFDPLAGDDSHYDPFLYTARAGERVIIRMSSEDFDSYLVVGRVVGGEFSAIESNDDGPGMGTDSELRFTFPTAGDYVIRANSLTARSTGDYLLSVQQQR